MATRYGRQMANKLLSPDGKQIAFATDRNGNFDVYLVVAEGGVAQRITTNSASEIPLAFSPNGKEIYFSAQIQKAAENVQFASGWITELYKVSIGGGRPEQVVAVPVSSMSFDKDGKSFLYYDRKGSFSRPMSARIAIQDICLAIRMSYS